MLRLSVLSVVGLAVFSFSSCHSMKRIETTPAFFGLPVNGKNVIFAVDTSSSMTKPHPSQWADKSKLKVAQEELGKTIQQLPEDAQFFVISYDKDISLWRQSALSANESARESAIKHINALKTDFGTNVHAALAQIFDLAEAHQEALADAGKPYVPLTVFLLSDGMPVGGEITDPQMLLQMAKSRNRCLHITIHAVYVSGEDPAQDARGKDFFFRLAAATGGRFISK